MKRKITHIRDLAQIEKELFNTKVGVLALTVERDKVIQLATTFVYLHKNIYVFFDEGNEIYRDVNLENNGNFIVLQNRSTSGKEYLTSTSISGSVKKVDDNRTMTEVREEYIKKYSKTDDLFQGDISVLKALFIDSEEFLAIEQEE